MDASKRRVLFGTDEPEPPTLALRAGPLYLRLRGTRLLPVHAGAHEIWHGVAFLYRDTGWGTPEPVVTEMPGPWRRVHLPPGARLQLPAYAIEIGRAHV